MRTLELARRMPVTLSLMAISIAITLLSSFGENRHMLSVLYISEYTGGGLREVFHGQLWRLLTPIFMHFSLIFILFYLLWLLDLGGTLERAQGSLRMLLLVAVYAVLGNVAQYLWAGPNFGGMSGVVYGLLAYTWIQLRQNANCGLLLNRYTELLLMLWFVMCWTGIIANAASMAQTAGLFSGLALGWVLSGDKFLRQKTDA